MSKKVKAPKQHADTDEAPEKGLGESDYGNIEVVGCEPSHDTLAAKIWYLRVSLTCDWPVTSGREFEVGAFDAAIVSNNTEQREWLIKHHPLYGRFSRKIREKSADAWIALSRAMIAYDEGKLDKAEQYFKGTNELLEQLGNMRPNTKAKQEAQSKGGNASADKHQGVVQYCAELIHGSDITQNDLRSPRDLAEKLAGSVRTYIQDHAEELHGSQLENHADENADVEGLIMRWLSQAKDNVAKKAYEERLKREGLPAR